MLGVVNTECCYAECHGANFSSSLLLQPSKLGRLQPNIGSTAMIGRCKKKLIQGYRSTWENPNTLAYFINII